MSALVAYTSRFDLEVPTLELARLRSREIAQRDRIWASPAAARKRMLAYMATGQALVPALRHQPELFGPLRGTFLGVIYHPVIHHRALEELRTYTHLLFLLEAKEVQVVKLERLLERTNGEYWCDANNSGRSLAYDLACKRGHDWLIEKLRYRGTTYFGRD